MVDCQLTSIEVTSMASKVAGALYPKSNNRLSAWDYSVVGALLVVSAFVGVYYGVIRGKQNQSQAAYFFGERQLSIAPVAMSLMASFFSALTLVSVLHWEVALGKLYLNIHKSIFLRLVYPQKCIHNPVQFTFLKLWESVLEF